MASTCGYDYKGAPRVAQRGFYCTAFPAVNIWGFCPTTVLAVSDCGLAGYCFDSGSCSTGCGRHSDGPDYLTVLTCTEDTSCSIVVSDNGGGQLFDYVACGREATTQTIYDTPPSVAASTTSTFAVSMTPSTSVASTTESPSTSNTSSGPSSSSAPTAGMDNTASLTSSAASVETSSAPHRRAPPPTGAIIGGVLGGVALLCLTVLAIFWIRRKNNSSSHKSPRLPHEAGYGSHWNQDTPSSISHIDGRYDPPYEKEAGIEGPFEAQAYRDPAELPAK